ncbi:helix-turn-helix domain-containing protein [Rubrivivax sp. JA1024]|nr:helix-turn-helix domain-containing protein [Rubrivivax sp. JA1024]
MQPLAILVAAPPMSLDRCTHECIHDDGINSWTMASISAPSDIADLIQGYCDYREHTGGFTTRRELPHAEGVFIVNLGDPISITGGDGAVLSLKAGEAFVAGAHLRPALSHSSGAQAGVHIYLPLATLRRLLGTPMHELADRVVGLDALLGRSATDLCCSLQDAAARDDRVRRLDQALRRRLRETDALSAQQQHALRLLRGRPDLDISAISKQIGWTRKHLASRVRDAVGVGPRSFRRLLRFQTLTRLIGRDAARPDWAQLAVEAGYYDQPHMINEFVEFSGLTPTAYLARSLPNGGGLIEA